VPLKSQAVLFRASHHSAQLEIELSRRNIPFVKYGGLKFLEAAHVKNALGEPDPFLNLAIGEHRQEGAAEQLVVTGIAAQCGTVIGRRRRDVALTARVPSGEIAAQRGGAGKALARLRLRPS
jgi:hypothetical protein